MSLFRHIANIALLFVLVIVVLILVLFAILFFFDFKARRTIGDPIIRAYQGKIFVRKAGIQITDEDYKGFMQRDSVILQDPRSVPIGETIFVESVTYDPGSIDAGASFTMMIRRCEPRGIKQGLYFSYNQKISDFANDYVQDNSSSASAACAQN